MRTFAVMVTLMLVAFPAGARDDGRSILQVKGDVLLGADATLEGDLVGLAVWTGPDASGSLTIRAPGVHVTRRDEVVLGDYRVIATSRDATYNLTDVTIHLRPNPLARQAVLQLPPGEQDAVVTAVAPHGASVGGRSVSQAYARNGDAPSDRELLGGLFGKPYARAALAGSVHIEGAGRIHIDGYVADILARENVTREETGRVPLIRAGDVTIDDAGPEQHTWLELELPALEMTGTLDEPAVLALPAVHVDAPNGASFHPVAGEVVVAGQHVRPGAYVRIDSATAFSLAPFDESAATLSFAAYAPVPPAAVVRDRAWNAALLGAGALAVAAVILSAGRYGILLDMSVARMDAAAARRADHRAAAWARMASILVPRSAEIHANRAYFLLIQGKEDAALAAYARSEHIAKDGTAAFEAAIMLAGRRAPDSTVLDQLARAVRADARHAEAALDEPALARVLSSPAGEAVIALAPGAALADT